MEWHVGDTVRVTISGSNWTMAVLDSGSYVDYAKGTVTASGTALAIKVTHLMADTYYDSGSGSGESFPMVPPVGPGGSSGTEESGSGAGIEG